MLQRNIFQEAYLHNRHQLAPRNDAPLLCNAAQHRHFVRLTCEFSGRDRLIRKTQAFYNSWMSIAIIIVIGWLYVTVLMAFTEPNIVSGILTFLFYGLLPSGVIFYLATAKIRRQRRKFREMMAEQKAENDGR